MFEILSQSYDAPGFFRLFGFVSFRALMGALFATSFCIFLGPALIRKLHQIKFGESIRGDGPTSHQAKAGTPTMGGLLILASVLFSCILWGDLRDPIFLLVLGGSLALGGIGFLDDYTKLRKKKGFSARLKMLLTLLVAFSFSMLYYQFVPVPAGQAGAIEFEKSGLFVPFIKGQVIDLTIYMAIPFWMLVLVGSAHAVNLTDGLDGLASGTVIIVAATLGALAYITGTPRAANYLNLPYIPDSHEISVFLAALTGATLGFLWFNAAPALVFMGDTGSLALGGALGMAAIVIKKELLLFICGGIFVAEALSVILQVLSFKLTKKRIFRMSPLHHHFELTGWPETRVVIRFWLIGILLSLLALSTLRIQ